jgi:Predicted nucleotide-binding protein containing TIR-like domain
LETRLSVVFSFQRRDNLSKRQLRFYDALLGRIEAAGLRICPESRGSDRIEDRYLQVKTSHGVVVLVLGQWEGRRLNRDQDRSPILPSEFTHIAASMAVAADRPLLVLREKSVDERGAFRSGSVHPIIDLPNSLDPAWLDSPSFEYEFKKWLEKVRCFRHVFLGYSSKAEDVGAKIQLFLTQKLGLQVFDWHDFRPGDSIWDSIERAERRTMSGIFLFMADDKFSGATPQFAPRDNVVFEAGYFAGAKGRSQSLIVHEKNAKIPSDLGGILYLTLQNRSSISSIETRLEEHMVRILSGAAGS